MPAKRIGNMKNEATSSDPTMGKGNHDRSSRATAAALPSETGPRWTFMTNHSHVLLLIHGQADTTIRAVAARVGITERAVQRIIQDLETGGFIERERVGRRNRYVVLMDQSLRHAIEEHRKVGDLLNLLSQDEA
jgi:hypothetical protein